MLEVPGSSSGRVVTVCFVCSTCMYVGVCVCMYICMYDIRVYVCIINVHGCRPMLHVCIMYVCTCISYSPVKWSNRF